MAPLLFALAEEIDGRRSSAEVAERLSHRIRRGVNAEMVDMLVAERLHPLGIVATAEEGTAEHLRRVDPLLALKFRAKVVPARWVSAVTKIFQPLFAAPVLAAAIAGFVALDVWLFVVHGISQSVRHTLYDPALLLMLLGGVIVGTAFHELGHATACRCGGAKPGVMGVGIYIVWPAFYTDVTDAYRLGRRGRLRTDLGGVYFNAVFALAVGALYFISGFEPLLLLVVLQNFAIVQQLLPFLRLDGYYVISDLTGVPDILMRIKPILASLVPRRPASERVTELRPWVRVAVTAYVALLVPLVGFVLLIMLIHAPRVFSTAYDSFLVHYDSASAAFGRGDGPRGVVDGFQMAMLALPALGMALTGARVAKRVGVGSWRWSARSMPRQVAVAAATAGFVCVVASLWWPNGEYRPIQPAERGTLPGAVESIEHIPTGRPALTVQRQEQLGGAPTLRQVEQERSARPNGPASGGPATQLQQRSQLAPPVTGQPTAGGDAPTGTTTDQSTTTDTTTTPTDTTPTTTTDTQPTQTTQTTTTPTDTTQTQTSTTPTQTQTDPTQPPPTDTTGSTTTTSP